MLLNHRVVRRYLHIRRLRLTHCLLVTQRLVHELIRYRLVLNSHRLRRYCAMLDLTSWRVGTHLGQPMLIRRPVMVDC